MRNKQTSAGADARAPVSQAGADARAPVSQAGADARVSNDAPQFDWKNYHRGWHARGYLPHCDFPGLVQAIGFRLFDSVPPAVIDRWIRELEYLPFGSRQDELIQRIDRYADMGYGCCYLKRQTIAQLVEESLLHHDGDRYHLLAWCVMSNHVHILAVASPGNSLSALLQNWKSYTAHQANKLLDRTGQFWFADYFDEFMKSTEQMQATIQYIERNPVTAKLVARVEDWRYSSAAACHAERVQRNRMIYSEIDPNQLPW